MPSIRGPKLPTWEEALFVNRRGGSAVGGTAAAGSGLDRGRERAVPPTPGLGRENQKQNLPPPRASMELSVP